MIQALKILALVAALQVSGIADEPKIEDVDWESACGGSNIRFTRVKGKIVAIDAYAEHFSEGRQWQCHYVDGKLVSALYRHFKVTRKSAGDEGQFTTEQHDDVVAAFHFPDHKLTGMPRDLLKDLQEVLIKGTTPAKP